MTALLATAGLACLAAGAQAQVQERTIRVSNGVNEDHPVGNGLAKMNQCVGEKSGGKIKLQGFWGGALGGDLQATQALRSGTQEMVITSTSPLIGVLPALGVFDLPFLFNNEKEADAVLDGEFGTYITEMMPGVGLVNLAYWENGFRNLTNSRHPVAKVEDFSGIKVRVMQNNVFLDTFKTLGSNAVPMAFGEVFTALETNAIDGQENPTVTIDTSKFYEVQDYLSVTRHAYTPFMVLYSKAKWDELSPEEQAILKDCAIVGRDEQRAVSRAKTDESLARLKEEGMEVNEVDPAEVDKMREAVKPVYDKHAEAIGKEIVDRMMAELAKIRGKS
jgi:tripartite ATP-independent transporter DctP family solute receptor